MSDTISENSIIEAWLNSIVETASERNHAAHMNLISKKVSLTGMPGYENLGFDDWFNQCQHEFEDKLISSIHYQGLKIRAATDSRIMFVTQETIVASDGTQHQRGIESLLELEDDDVWRLTQQRVLGEEETTNYLS